MQEPPSPHPLSLVIATGGFVGNPTNIAGGFGCPVSLRHLGIGLEAIIGTQVRCILDDQM